MLSDVFNFDGFGADFINRTLEEILHLNIYRIFLKYKLNY